MKIEQRHPNFRLPTRSTELAGGFDLYMPEAGFADTFGSTAFGLGFAAEVPEGFVALLLPRSGAGGKGLELANTCGVIDADYRGEWIAKLRTKSNGISWAAGDRLLQFLLVPVLTPALELVESVSKTERGEGGFGSTGK